MKKKTAFILIAAVSVAICGFYANPAPAEQMEQMEGSAPRAEAPEKAPKVEASGTALWDYLKKENYEQNWKMWPGKSAFYEGTEPHGALLTTYANSIAYEAIEAKEGRLPDGSIIVKENYSPEKELKGLTVMYKVKDFNPEADDWFWAKYEPDGKIDSAGKVEMCIQCHGQKKNNDFIMTAPLK